MNHCIGSIAARCWGGSNGTCFLRTPWIFHIILLGILMMELQKNHVVVCRCYRPRQICLSCPNITKCEPRKDPIEVKTLQTNHHYCLRSPCSQQSSAALSDFLHTIRLPIPYPQRAIPRLKAPLQSVEHVSCAASPLRFTYASVTVQ